MTAVAIRGTTYPVVFPKLRDPRLHLAVTITSLQVLGQVAFSFRLSISQILVALATCAILEIAITFRSKRGLMWPASALLTGTASRSSYASPACLTVPGGASTRGGST